MPPSPLRRSQNEDRPPLEGPGSGLGEPVEMEDGGGEEEEERRRRRGEETVGRGEETLGREREERGEEEGGKTPCM